MYVCICMYVAISHAMARDGSSGGVIRMVIIDQTGIEKEVILGKLVMFLCMYVCMYECMYAY